HRVGTCGCDTEVRRTGRLRRCADTSPVTAANNVDDGCEMSGPISRWFKMPTLSERLRAAGVREDLILAAERTAFSRQSDREIPVMAAQLTDDEGVIQLVEARHAGPTGLLVLTSRRLLFVPAAASSHSPTVVELPDVKTVDSRRHRGLGVL